MVENSNLLAFHTSQGAAGLIRNLIRFLKICNSYVSFILRILKELFIFPRLFFRFVNNVGHIFMN